MENKIPKVIHYCWFSGEEMPPFIKQCMDSWSKYLPDYKLRLWDSSSFDFDSVPFVRDAYKARKWAFVTDYVRLYALYTEGGIYMDTDIKVMKSFDEFLGYNFFTSHEVHPHFYPTEPLKLDENFRPKDPNEFILGWSIQAALMASVPGLPYLKDCMEYYQRKSFYTAEGTIDLSELIIGKHITMNALKYGYRYVDEDQLLEDNMMIKKSDVFVGNMLYLTDDSYAIHLCNGSWLEDNKDWEWKLRNYHPTIYMCLNPLLRVWRKVVRTIKK